MCVIQVTATAAQPREVDGAAVYLCVYVAEQSQQNDHAAVHDDDQQDYYVYDPNEEETDDDDPLPRSAVMSVNVCLSVCDMFLLVTWTTSCFVTTGPVGQKQAACGQG